MRILIFTDGSCNPKTRHGGWAVILQWVDLFAVSGVGVRKEKILSESIENTTISRMELTAIREGLRALKLKEAKYSFDTHIYCDSQYAIDVITGEKKAHLNKDLIEQIWAVEHPYLHITYHHINSHTNKDDYYYKQNARVDLLAQEERRKLGRNN